MTAQVLLASYGPAVVYLVLVTVALLVTGRCPWWVHPAALTVGVTVRLVLAGPPALIPVALAVVLYVVGVSVGRRFLSGAGRMTLVVSAAVLPFSGVPGLAAGLFLAGLAGAVIAARSGGVARVQMLTGTTLLAMGVSGAGLTRPDLALLPAIRTDPASANPDGPGLGLPGRRLYLAPYLLVGVLSWAAIVTAGPG